MTISRSAVVRIWSRGNTVLPDCVYPYFSSQANPWPKIRRERGRERVATSDAYVRHAYADSQGKAPSVRSVRARLTAKAHSSPARRTVSRAERRRGGRAETRRSEMKREFYLSLALLSRVCPRIPKSHLLPRLPSSSATNLFFLHSPTILCHFHESHQDHRWSAHTFVVLLHTSLKEIRIINHRVDRVGPSGASLRSEIRDSLRCPKWKKNVEF